LTAEVAVKLRQSGLPVPGALGIFSGNGDFSRIGDSQAIYALNGFSADDEFLSSVDAHLAPGGMGR
jgi:hypothetical protein